MATITLKGNPVHTVGSLPEVGTAAPDFTLTKTDLSDLALADLRGQRVVLNIFPSVDTPTCATSVRTFNAQAAALSNTAVLCVSRDLPFAHARFCGAEGLETVHGVSDFRHPSFGADYGVTISDGKLAGLFSRAVVVIDDQGTVIHSAQVPEIADEPDYAAALACLA